MVPTLTPGMVVTDRPGHALPEGVSNTFTHLCIICGATVSVVDGASQAHRCVIVIP
jgi:hypothetical protein